MSMSTHVVGFRPPDAKWAAMKAVWKACEEAGTSIPDEVLKFFDHETSKVNEPGAEVSLGGAVTPYKDDCGSEGFELDVSKLPSDVKIIRFYNNW